MAAPHGVICARLLPFVMEASVRALLSRNPDSPALVRYGQIAQLVTGKSAAEASDALEWIKELCAALKVPRLSEFGLREDDLPAAVTKSQKSSSMKGNPIRLTDEELLEVLRQASD